MNSITFFAIGLIHDFAMITMAKVKPFLPVFFEDHMKSVVNLVQKLH